MVKPEVPPHVLDAMRVVLRFVGEDPEREGLRETPRRVVQSLIELTAGRHEDASDHLAVDFDPSTPDGTDYDEVVLLRDIEFVSTCEHHLLPFSGVAHIAYLPSDRVVGLSKLARTVDVFARRLQLQERLTTQIAEALRVHLKPRGVAVVLRASHSCMSCRGVRKAGATMVMSALRGAFRESDSARAEVLALMGVGGR
jgi:GTP cyclohydrolase I